jgi:methyl-accepting chemotaxis protein
MRVRFHLRLAHKIMAIAAVGLAGLLTFGAIYQIGGRSQDSSRTFAENARGIAELNQRLHVELLEARRTEKDFQLRRDETYVKRHTE